MNLENVRYRILGEGQTLLLVNMHFQRLEAWDRIAFELARYYRVINFEFPNQGDSDTNAEMTNLRDYAAFAKDFLETLGENTEEIIAVGYSFAANILRIMNLEMKVNFKAMIIGGINPLKLRDYYIEMISGWNRIYEKCGIDEFAKHVAMRILSPHFISKNPSVIDVIQRALNKNYDGKPERVQAIMNAPGKYYEVMDVNIKETYSCDVHIIGCDYDMIVPCQYVQEYAKAIHAESFHVINECGHDPLMEQASEVFNIIDEISDEYAD